MSDNKTIDEIDNEYQPDGAITAWVHGVAKNLHFFEQNEGVVWDIPRDTAVMNYVIRALANPQCEGSDMVLLSIIEQRLIQGKIECSYTH